MSTFVVPSWVRNNNVARRTDDDGA